MCPVLFQIGSLSVYGYGLMIGLGAAAALWLAWKREKLLSISQQEMTIFSVLILACGFGGAKLMYILVNFRDLLSDPSSVLGGEGFVVYGGIIGGLAAGLLWCRSKRKSPLLVLDFLSPVAAIGQGFGRLGCLLAGCCYGAPTDSFLGITFPAGCSAPAGVPLWPVQIFSSVFDFALCGVLLLIEHRQPKRGTCALIYLYSYSVGRFLIEFLRDDVRGSVGVLSTSQFVSILIFLFAVVLTVITRRQKPANAEA